jgi:hypothetical protein
MLDAVHLQDLDEGLFGGHFHEGVSWFEKGLAGRLKQFVVEVVPVVHETLTHPSEGRENALARQLG